MSDNSIDIPILKGNDSLSKKQPSLPYFQATSKSNSSQNEKWRKTFNISFIFCIIITVIFLIPLIHKKESYDIHDTNSCSALINNGHWVSSPSKNNSYWQPETCVIKKYRYDLESIQVCLKDTNINFVGDITLSRLFQYLEAVVFGSITSSDDIKEKKTIERNVETTKLVYHQDNFFDSEYFNQLLKQNTSMNTRNIFILSSGKTIINDNLNSKTNEINEVEFNKDKDEWSKNFLQTLVKIQRTNNEYYIRLLTPIFDIDEDQPISKRLIEWNDYITQVTEDIREKDINGKGNIHVPLSWNKLYYDSIYDYDKDNRDEFIKNIVREELNLFLNSICNSKINTTDSTCCINYSKSNIKQDIILILLFIFGPLSLFYRKIIQKYYLVPPMINRYIPDDDLVINLTTLALTIYFSYITDHTALFLKANKQYSIFKYLVLLILISVPIINSIETSKNTTILNSEQVSEWQGLILVLYLIIQYCNDSEGDISNNITRVFISSYMFLIGYSNYDYYYRKGNYEIINFIYLILKKVTLPLILAFSLNNSIIDYFFPIMNIFWSLIIYSTMGILASYNNKRKFFLIKLGCSIGITFLIFVLLPFISKYIFIILSVLFGVEWNYLQWNQYISLDFWTVWIGVGFSYLINNIYETVDDLASHKFKISTLNIIGIASSIGGCLFVIPIMFIASKGTYDKIHPWISFIIPIAYLLLRNSNHIMRKRISKFLCWIGSFSMEIYVLYNHFLISSSSNGHGVIIYIHNSYWCNLIVSCIILIWLSYTMSKTINGLCRWIINSFFNLSLSSANTYNALNNSSTSNLHYDINGSVNLNNNTINNLQEPSSSDAQVTSDSNEENNLNSILNNNSQENLTLMQDPNNETLKSIQYRWFGLIILLWIINIL
ncbi:hypothetical protein H8356DRAFT_1673448 [Neocallimastix lanati (nom. inval.)]|jgi:hypothetical protein|uniref:Cas1p 10 TM acyl transferase domain-containing protein n=1 Tax=Neocallimastix californiae TaxID=1754190 RepID=A0A1Y2CMU8_9FUNG|nr:hypothetical protein H8356DRAFT_1673448 [Neocallimastix sp. JGI-2020a]ORY48350.1 hypothetical protein LY90DRAFT_671028 [Neocallimastix californiae]|eukprot:ORY48350.1 hypothetical protein LY90DRAFT_671028 [Neocallimastix californiae]